MKGDFSRSTFKKEKHYRKVNMQQGRVQLDSDWNEQTDIHTYYERAALQDIIGDSGTKSGNNGFEIIPNGSPLFSWDNVPGSDTKALKEFLKQYFSVYWIETLIFEKSSEKTITTSDGTNSLSLELNDDKTKATLKINGNIVYEEFIVKIKDDKIKIYQKLCTYKIGAGHYYVDGILCENETDIDALGQSDLPLFSLIETEYTPVPYEVGTYLAYLDVWERHLTALDDPHVSEPALGGADTATRTKIVWQVKLLNIDNVRNCSDLSSISSWIELVRPSTGTLKARSKPQKNNDVPCIMPPGAGYREIENQLYRVEIHNPGEPGKGATFKWSKDNGAVVTGIKNISGTELTVTDTGRDKLLGFDRGQWVEVTDNCHELWGIPGTLAKLTDVKGNTLFFDTDSVLGITLNNDNYPQEFNPKARRWDSAGSIDVTIPGENDGYIELEKGIGIEVKFAEGTYKTNDYWLIPARTTTGDVEWPRIDNTPEALYPQGIEHHFCPLAILEYDNDGFFNLITDCRKFFPATTALNGLSANTGIIDLTLRRGHDILFGPFEHWLENLCIPPAIILGLSKDNAICEDISQSIKAVNVNLKTFMVQVPPLTTVRESNLKLRWWSIPGQEKGVQIGKPLPSVIFDPSVISIGKLAKIIVNDPKAKKDKLGNIKIDIVSASILGQDGKQSESDYLSPVDATEIGPNTGFFEVTVQITHKDNEKTKVTIGNQTMEFDGMFEPYGGYIEARYEAANDATIIGDADILKLVTGSIKGKVTDTSKYGILGAKVSIKDNTSGKEFNQDTGSAGDYSFQNVPPNQYVVTASARGFRNATKPAKVIPNQTITVDFSLESLNPIGTIIGKVTDTENNPISTATLSVNNTNISSKTDSSGNYILRNVPVGKQTVKAESFYFISDTLTVTVNEGQTTIADFKLPKESLCTIGNPDANICLVGMPTVYIAGIEKKLSSFQKPEIKPREREVD